MSLRSAEIPASFRQAGWRFFFGIGARETDASGMRLIWFFLILAVPVLGSWLLWGGAWEAGFTLDGSVRWLEGSGRWAWAAGIVILSGDLVLPVPTTMVISGLGFIYGTWLGGWIASVGLMVAGLAGYGVGRLCGERLARRWLGDRDFDRGHALFTRRGGWVVALSRALPVLPEVISCMAGVLRMPFRRFLISLAFGSLPMGFIFAWIGQTGHAVPWLSVVLSLLVPALLWALASRVRW